tara:strand:+ start:276 stop:500 length:225 start_codon:yes stop_codon:yes gene_type:complete
LLLSKPPFVLKGEHMAASTFWHGDKLNEWANNWTHYWTAGQGKIMNVNQQQLTPSNGNSASISELSSIVNSETT